MTDCCEDLLAQVRALRGESEGLSGILPRIARLEAEVQAMQNGDSVDLSPVLNQLSQLRSQVSGISGEIQSSEGRITSAILTALSGIEALIRTIIAEVIGAIRQMSADVQLSIRAISSDLLAALRVVAGEIRNAINEVIAPIAQAIATLIQMIASSGNGDSDAVSAINVAKSEIISHIKLESAETKGLIRQAQAQVINTLESFFSILQRVSSSLVELASIPAQIRLINDSINALKSLILAINNRFDGLEVVINSLLSGLRDLSGQIQSALRGMFLELVAGLIAQIIALLANQGSGNDAVSAINVAKSEIISHIKLESAETKELVRQAQAQIITALEYLSFLLQRVSTSLGELASIPAQIRFLNESINALKSLILAINNRFDGLEVVINSLLSGLRDLSGQIQSALRGMFLELVAGLIAQIIALLANQGSGNDAVSAINVAKSEIISHIKLESAEVKALVRQLQQQVINSFSALTVLVRDLSQQVRDFSSKVERTFTEMKDAIKSAADRSEAQTKDQTKQILEALKKAIEPVLKQLGKSLDRIAKIYAVLGGTFWGDIDNQSLPEGRLDPEYLISQARTRIYGNGNTSSDLTVLNLINVISNLFTVGYQRSGFYRFPATVPKNITDSSQETIQIYDAASWQEWLFLQLDSISGNYPIKIKYKNASGENRDIEFSNQAEAIAELIGLTMSLDVDTDILQELAFKGIAETIKGQAAAITASDYSKANAKYLGYRHTEKERDIKLSVSPGATSIKNALKPSTKKLTTWEFAGGNDLQDTLQALVTAGEMTKASVFRPWDILSGELPGDRIKSDQEDASNQDDQSWAEFIAEIKNPPANQLDPTAPRADIRNLAQNEGAE